MSYEPDKIKEILHQIISNTYEPETREINRHCAWYCLQIIKGNQLTEENITQIYKFYFTYVI